MYFQIYPLNGLFYEVVPRTPDKAEMQQNKNYTCFSLYACLLLKNSNEL